MTQHEFKADPMNDDHYDSNDDQIADLKAEVLRLTDICGERLDTLKQVLPFLEGFDDADYEREMDEEGIVRPMIKKVSDTIKAAEEEGA